MSGHKENINKISSILKGEFITERNNIKLVPYLLLIVLLGLFSIRSSFNAENLLKQSIALEKETADLRLTYITTKSQLMSLHRRSVIEDLVASHGLKTSINPPEILSKQ